MGFNVWLMSRGLQRVGGAAMMVRFDDGIRERHRVERGQRALYWKLFFILLDADLSHDTLHLQPGFSQIAPM